MQWNVQELENWEELRTYVDTALLPLYLYRPEKPVNEHVQRMSYLVQVAASIEQRLKGRVLLFPICYQIGDEPLAQRLPAGFAHYVLLQFSGERLDARVDEGRLLRLTVGDEDLDSALRFEVTVDVLSREIIRLWQHGDRQ
jgi:hypothetical protein